MFTLFAAATLTPLFVALGVVLAVLAVERRTVTHDTTPTVWLPLPLEDPSEWAGESVSLHESSSERTANP